MDDKVEEYVDVKLNDEEAALPSDEMAMVAGQKEIMRDYVNGKDPDGLKKCLKIERALTTKRKAERAQAERTTKNGRSRR